MESFSRTALLLIAIVLGTFGCVSTRTLPIHSGEYRFELRDPEFPQLESIPLRARIDGRHALFETLQASSRFPEGTRFEGDVVWNDAAKKWVLASEPDDAKAKAAGNCSDGPEVVDLEHFIFWFC
jgi:hypothetical protein